MTELLEAREQKLIEMNQTNVDLQESNSDLKRYCRLCSMLGLLFQINFMCLKCIVYRQTYFQLIGLRV